MNDYKDNSFSSSSPNLKIRASRYLLQLLLLGLAVHIILSQLTTLEDSVQVIHSMILWAVLVAMGSQILSYFGSGYLLKETVTLVGQRLTIIWGIIITLAASSIGLIAAGVIGNAAATYNWMRKMGISEEGALLAGSLPSFYNNVVLLVLSIFGIVHLLLIHQLSMLQLIIFTAMLLIMALCAGFIVWGYSHRQQFASIYVVLGSRLARLSRRSYTPQTAEGAVSRMFGSMDALHGRGWRGPAVGAVMSTGFDMVTLYFLFIAAGHSVSPGVLLTGYGLPLLLGKMAFLIPGGVGVVEGTMALLYTGLGVQNSVTVVVILVYRIFSFWLPTLLGFPLAAYLQKSGDHLN